MTGKLKVGTAWLPFISRVPCPYLGDGWFIYNIVYPGGFISSALRYEAPTTKREESQNE